MMTNTLDRRAPATTWLTHYFGGGLVDKGECYVVERYRSMSSGEIRHWPGETPSGSNGRSRPKPEVASVDEVRELRPLYNEIIVCTGLGTRSGVQYYGSQAIWGPLRRRRFPL
ncbi:MAG: hypothetical protein OXQ29_21025 [Rhodospirillaceae bacterium]|nr:hypothetical protein [Rhodospirillaceae bacterium]